VITIKRSFSCAGIDVNLEYGDLGNENLDSRTQKWDHNIPYNHAFRPKNTPTTTPTSFHPSNSTN